MLTTWSAKTRQETVARAGEKEFDLIIIGGGITGAGIARECALRKLSFCLLDKNDFAFGTSSRSSKLFHGGLRYLASGEFRLVRESTVERNWLRCHLPNLVRPLAFVYPAFQKGKSKTIKVRLAVFLYDLISNSFSKYKNYRRGRIFKASFIEEIEPAITLEDPDLGKMTIAGFYYDTNCDDARVTLEIIKESIAASEDESAALNYCHVSSFLTDDHGKAVGVRATDQVNGVEFTVKGRCVISASGIWTDQVLSAGSYSNERIYPTKGVHIVVPSARLGNRNAFGLTSFEDGRFFFILNRGQISVIGTTDTAYPASSSSLDEPWCTREDCDYLLSTVNRLFPHARLSDRDIIGTYAGIRPLIRSEKAKNESDVSRKHEIFQTEDGIVAIAGGKSTTHRLMAEDLIFYLIENGYLKRFSALEYNRRGFSRQPFKIGLTRKEFDRILDEKDYWNIVHPDQVKHLYTQYGRGAVDILEMIKTNRAGGEPLLDEYPYSEAEIIYILEHECAPMLIDLLCRRTEAQWTVWHYKQQILAMKVADIMSDYYGWSNEEKSEQLKEYLEYVRKTVSFLKF